MSVVSLSTLATQVREAADMVASDFVSDNEIYGLLVTYLSELYDMLVSAYGHEYYAEQYTLTTIPGQESYQISEYCPQLYKLLGIDLDLGDGVKQSLLPFSFSTRNRDASRHYRRLQGIRYRLHGDSILLSPAPDAAYKLTVHYIPLPNIQPDADEVFNGYAGWERYAVVCAAIACLSKEQSDCSILMAEKSSLTMRIQAMAKNRDAGEPQQIGRNRWHRGSY